MLLFDVASPRLTLFALKLHYLDRRTDLSALWDQAVMLSKCAYLLAAYHDDIIFCGVIIDRNGSMFSLKVHQLGGEDAF